MTDTHNREHRIEYMRLDDFIGKFHPRNPKSHDLGKIDYSYDNFGYVEPVTVDENTGYVVAGHGRGEQLFNRMNKHDSVPDGIQVDSDGMWKLPVIRGIHFKDESHVEAYLVASNNLTIQGGWHDEELAGLLSDLAVENENLLNATGFDTDDLNEMLAVLTPDLQETPDAQIDRAEELNETWQVKSGDLWIIPSAHGGEHRLLCGDSTNEDDVKRLMGGDVADLGLTDPPYGVKMDKGFGGERGFGGKGKQITVRSYSDDWDSERPTQNTLEIFLKHCKSSIIFGGNFFADILPQSSHWIVWDKLNTMPTFGDCELAWTNIDRKSVKKITFEYNGLIGKEKERFHPTQKPAGLFAEIINLYTEQNQTVCDTFLGSGTTMVACESTNRVCFGLELESKYCAVILQRMSDMGLEPVLSTDPTPDN